MRKALVIGGTTGIGAALVEVFNNMGVIATGVGRDEFDVCNKPYDTDLGEYDYLVLSCGIDPNGHKIHLDQEWNDIETILYTNLIGQMKFAHRYLNQRKGKWSKLIFIGSAHNGDHIQPKRLSYGITRYAQRSYINALRHELCDEKHGILLIRVGKARTNLLKNRLLESWTREADDQYYSDAHLTMYDIQERIPLAMFDEEHYIQEIVIAVKPI